MAQQSAQQAAPPPRAPWAAPAVQRTVEAAVVDRTNTQTGARTVQASAIYSAESQVPKSTGGFPEITKSMLTLSMVESVGSVPSQTGQQVVQTREDSSAVSETSSIISCKENFVFSGNYKKK